MPLLLTLGVVPAGVPFRRRHGALGCGTLALLQVGLSPFHGDGPLCFLVLEKTNGCQPVSAWTFAFDDPAESV